MIKRPTSPQHRLACAQHNPTRAPHMAVLIIVFLVARTLLYGCQNIPRARACYKSIVHHKTTNLTHQKSPHTQPQLSHAATSSHQQDEPPLCFSSSDLLLVGMDHLVARRPHAHQLSKRTPRWKPSRFSWRSWSERTRRRTSVAHTLKNGKKSPSFETKCCAPAMRCDTPRIETRRQC